jgi:hypothetical protein
MYGATQKPICREKFARSMEQTWVYNFGDRDISFTHDGTPYLLLAHTKEQYPARVVWLLLGDPDLRPGMRNKPTFGTNLTWSKEVERLMHMHGAWNWNPSHNNGQFAPPGRTDYDQQSIWEYILSGMLFSPDFCRRREARSYYSTATRIERPAHVSSIPLSEADDQEFGGTNRVSRAAIRTSHQALTEDDDDEGSAPVRRQVRSVAGAAA